MMSMPIAVLLLASHVAGDGYGKSDESPLLTGPPGVAIRIFDGQTLDGWSRRNGQPHPGWVVDDGALYRHSGGGDLYYRFRARDFELYFQWRIAAGGNSGLKYRVRPFGNSWLGCEYQILDDAAQRDANKSAGLYDVFDPSSDKPVVKAGVWNSARIVVCGNRIEHWLNGVMTVQATVGSQRWDQAVASSKFADVRGFGENREGRIFLQDHGDPVWFRQLVLIPLNCDGCCRHTGQYACSPAVPPAFSPPFRRILTGIHHRQACRTGCVDWRARCRR